MNTKEAVRSYFMVFIELKKEITKKPLVTIADLWAKKLRVSQIQRLLASHCDVYFLWCTIYRTHLFRKYTA